MHGVFFVGMQVLGVRVEVTWAGSKPRAFCMEGKHPTDHRARSPDHLAITLVLTDNDYQVEMHVRPCGLLAPAFCHFPDSSPWVAFVYSPLDPSVKTLVL